MVKLMQGEKVKKQLEYPYEKMYVRYVDEIVTNFSTFTTLLTKKEI